MYVEEAWGGVPEAKKRTRCLSFRVPTYPHVKVDEKIIVRWDMLIPRRFHSRNLNSLTYFKPESTFSKAHHFGVIHVEPLLLF